jgi:hypothetical protein
MNKIFKIKEIILLKKMFFNHNKLILYNKCKTLHLIIYLKITLMKIK